MFTLTKTKGGGGGQGTLRGSLAEKFLRIMAVTL